MFMSDSRPSLSRKITLGYYAIAIIVIGAAAVTFVELASLEAKVSLGERASELLETTLEIRRFERNYFLHRQVADYDANRQQVALARSFLAEHREGFAAIERPETLARFRDLLDTYDQRMVAYVAATARSSRVVVAENAVRATGKDIVAIAAEMAGTEKTVVRGTLARFRVALVLAIAVLAILVLLMSRTIARRIIGPLKTVEDDVEAVRRGRPGFLHAPTQDREIISITGAFNHMLRELELRQKHLVRSEKLASMGTMLSGVAHELNNPLSNISTSCQIMLEELEERDISTSRTLLAQIDSQCERARRIVRSLLDFSHNRDLRRECVLLRPLVEQTLGFVRGEMGQHIDVECFVTDDLAVSGDGSRLQQAFLNLIRNALQASHTGGRVSISARALLVASDAGDADPSPQAGCPLTGAVVDVEITDDGPGIAGDVMPRIFDPFFTTKAVGQGMGLGLFITHEIIDEHDGCIAVTTIPGKGTTFHIRLPAAQPETLR